MKAACFNPKQQQGAVLIMVLMSLLLLGLSSEMALRSSLLAEQVAHAGQMRNALRVAAEVALTRQRNMGLETAVAQTLMLEGFQAGSSTVQAELSAPRCVRADKISGAMTAIDYLALWHQEVTVTASNAKWSLEAWVRQVVSEATYQRICPQFRQESVTAHSVKA